MSRAADPLSTRRFDLQELWDTHKEINRRLVLGQKSVDIANDLGVTTMMVSYVKNSELSRLQRERLNMAADAVVKETAERIAQLAPRALDQIERIVFEEDTQAGLRAKLCLELLDRAGLNAVQKHQVVRPPIADEDIEQLKERGRQLGIVIDLPKPQQVEETQPLEVTPSA